MSESTIRVLIADDQRLIREGIASLLGIQPGLTIVGTAINGKDAVEKARQLTPDIVLMDIRMPEMDGIEATRQLGSADCRILMLTTFDDEEYIVKSLRAGAVGYLLKDLPAADLAQAIRLARAGIFQLDPSVAGKLIGVLGNIGSATATTQPPPAKTFDLSTRELEVLKLLADGATNREIAKALVISLGTVKNHVSNILGRLGLRDRVQAAIFARENNLA